MTEPPGLGLTVEVGPESLPDALAILKETEGLKFVQLMFQTGLDLGDRLGVVYSLYSFEINSKVSVKASVPKEDPVVPSACMIYKAADWFERETYDMFGIRFAGHRDLRRILLPDDWEGFPLRKDYVFPEGYGGIKHEREDICP